MRLLRLISWPYLKKHAVRSLLTVVGIVLGVAVFVAMHTANQAVFFAFERTVDRIAGASQLQVTAGEAGFPEEALERVQAISEVQVAVPVIEAPAGTKLSGQGNILILGVDMTGDRSLREYDLESGDEAVIDDPLVFLAQPDSIIITNEFASRNNLRVGDRLTLSTMIGDKPFTVRGIMRSGGLTSAFGGNLAIMDIYAAQQVFGRGRRFDRIDLKLREGVAVETGQAAIRKELGVGFDVEPPASRGQQLESTLAVYAISMNVSSVFALFIGMFIIYNSFSIAVTQRRSEIGILRALGAPRRQIRNLFLIESAASGLLGSIAGIALGIVMARGMVGSISNMLEGIYGVAERAEEVSADPKLLGAAIAIGIVTSMIAAWLPARNASRVDPVQALQKGKYQVLTAGENRARRLTAAVMMAAAIVMLWLGTSIWFYAGYTLIILSALMLVPTVALWFSRALRPVLKWLRPVEGALAADSLIQSPRRTSGAVAALMLSLGQVIGLGGVSRESYSSIRRVAEYRVESRSVRLGIAEPLGPNVQISQDPRRFDHRHSWRRRRAARAKSPREHWRRPGDADRHRRRQLRAPRPSSHRGRRSTRHVSDGERGARRHRVGQLRATSPQTGWRSRRGADARRAADDSDRRHHYRLVRSAGIDFSRPQGLRAVLEG